MQKLNKKNKNEIEKELGNKMELLEHKNLLFYYQLNLG
jgi:hypothetical protein